jgi:exodeoxyribonuclease VIII
VNYGYHAQEALYSDGYRTLDRNVEGFVFVAFEKKSPYAASVFELPPSIVDEGRAIMRQSLQTYAECQREDQWPAYGDGVMELQFSRWAYKLTPAPSGIGDDA